MQTLITNIKGLVQVREKSVDRVAGKDMDKLPVLPNAFLSLDGEKIMDFGSMKECPALDQKKIIDANGKFAQAVEADDSFAMGYFMVATTSQTAAEFFDATTMANEQADSASAGEQLYISALVAASPISLVRASLASMTAE